MRLAIPMMADLALCFNALSVVASFLAVAVLAHGGHLEHVFGGQVLQHLGQIDLPPFAFSSPPFHISVSASVSVFPL